MDTPINLMIIELKKVLPNSDFGKIVWLVIVCLFILVCMGRFKLEWIGFTVKYLYNRLVRCLIFRRHRWKLASIGKIDIHTGIRSGFFRCKYCRKVKYMNAV